MVEPWSWAWIGEKLWTMPGGVGAMIGALIGFLALAYVTRRGYENLIAAQTHQAAIARKAELDRIEWEQHCLAAGLAGELRAVRVNCSAHADYLREAAQEMDARAAGASSQPHEYYVELAPVAECAFFKANAGRLGILGNDLAGHVTTIYEMLATWRRDVQKDKKFLPLTKAKFLPRSAALIEDIMQEITDVIRRLEAIEQGLPDPGKDTAVPRKTPRWLARRSHRPVS